MTASASTDAEHLYHAAAMVLRYGMSPAKWAETLRNFRQVGEHEAPAVLLRAAVEAQRRPAISPAELAVFLVRMAASAKGAE